MPHEQQLAGLKQYAENIIPDFPVIPKKEEDNRNYAKGKQLLFTTQYVNYQGALNKEIQKLTLQLKAQTLSESKEFERKANSIVDKALRKFAIIHRGTFIEKLLLSFGWY